MTTTRPSSFAGALLEAQRIAHADPITVALEAMFRRIVRDELAPLREQLARLGQPVEPPTLTVRQAAQRCGMGEEAIRASLRRNPDLRIKNGTKLLVRWPQFQTWLLDQAALPSDRRPAPAVRRKTA